MSVIAWDGNVLAADMQVTVCGLKLKSSKIRKINDNLVSGCGTTSYVEEMMAWYEKGADPKDFPKFQEGESFCNFTVITKDRDICVYEKTAYPYKVSGKFYAMGSGRDYAMAAMHLGKSAIEAVDVASYFDCNCGLGVETLSFE